MEAIKLKNKNNEELIDINTITKYVLAYLNGNLDCSGQTWTEAKIPLTIKQNRTNSKIQINDGKLVIGANVHNIEISYSIEADSGNADIAIFTRLKKNNLNYIESHMSSNQNVQYSNISKTIIMPVTKNDVISLAYYFSAASSTAKILGSDGTNFKTYICVKILN